MILLYVFVAIAATVSALTLRRHLSRLALFALPVLVGCGTATPDGTGGSGSGGSTTTTSTTETTTSTTASDQCGGKCVPPQVCGIGCGNTPGCFTPGGDPDGGGPNDCPACFRDSTRDDQCSIVGLGEAYSCQKGAKPLGGCVGTGALECCPSPTCAGVSACPSPYLVTDCNEGAVGETIVSCCDGVVKRPTIACSRPAGILIYCGPGCGSGTCAKSPMGTETCCAPGTMADPCDTVVP